MGIEEVWAQIEDLQGQEFRQKRGGRFSYKVVGGHVVPDRTNHQIPRSQFAKAFERWPVAGPGELQDLRGPSYLFAILSDHRIVTSR